MSDDAYLKLQLCRGLQRAAHSGTRMVERELVTYLGAIDFRELRELDILGYVDRRLADGMSVNTIRQALSILRTVGNVAVRDGILERNPAAEVGRLMRRVEVAQASEARRPDAWTPGEVAGILALAWEYEARIAPAIAVLAYTGVRRGEALGLRWEDVDFARRQIVVRRRIYRGQTSSPKSGRERVPMAPELERILREVRAGAADGAPVLASLKGDRPMAEVVLNRAWRRLRSQHFAALGIRPLRLHDFRHTWATLALRAGRNVRWVADVLGHVNAAFTLNTYAHVLAEDEADLSFLDRFQNWNLTESRLLGPVSDDDTNPSEDNGFPGGRAPIRTGDFLLVRQVL